MKRWSVLVGLLLPLLAFAHGGVDAARRSMQASMLVTGTVTVDVNGNVTAYSLDQRGKLPPGVTKLIDETVPRWCFKSVLDNGKPVRAKAVMSLRVVALPDASGQFLATVKSAVFGDYAAQAMGDAVPAGSTLSYKRAEPPQYPMQLARQGVTGTAYVVVEIDRTGHVMDAAIRQVDLRTLGDATELANWRYVFSQATLAAVKRWTFNVPIVGAAALAPHWFVDIPVNYILENLRSSGASRYGQWNAYIPGPIQPLPWAKTDNHAAGLIAGADAIPQTAQPFVPDPRFVRLASTEAPSPAGKQAAHG